jgi:hypothetical protein
MVSLGASALARNHPAFDDTLLTARQIFCGVVSGGDRVATGNGFDDSAMLALLRLHEVDVPRFVAAYDAHALAKVLLEEAPEQSKLRVAGRPADHAMEGHIFGHAVAPGRAGFVDCFECPAQGSHLRAGRPFGSQRSNFASQHAPNFHHMHDGLHRLEHARIERKWFVDRSHRDVHPRAVPGNHQRPRLNLVHRFAHHSARQALRCRQLLLGGQSIAGPQRAGLDLRNEAQRKLVG